MNILITGSTGFIGRNIKEYLFSKYNLFCPTHKELELLNKDDVEKYIIGNKIDIIIHSAIHVPIFNGYDNEYINDIVMFDNIARMSKNVKKIIYFGSGAEYNKENDIDLVSEEYIDMCFPKTEYGRAKKYMNSIARKSTNIYNLRLFGVYGKYEIWEIKYLSNIICKCLHNFPISIRKDCYFDFLYIVDLCSIVEWFIINDPIFHDYNVCIGKNILLSDYAKEVLKTLNKKVPINILNDSFDKTYSGSNNRLLKEIPNFRFTNMNKAINDLATYYKSIDINLDILKNSK